VANADLYQELKTLGDSIDRWRRRDQDQDAESLGELVRLIREQAEACDLSLVNWGDDVEAAIEDLRNQLNEIEESLIPTGYMWSAKLCPEKIGLCLLQSISTAQGKFQPSEKAFRASPR